MAHLSKPPSSAGVTADSKSDSQVFETKEQFKILINGHDSENRTSLDLSCQVNSIEQAGPNTVSWDRPNDPRFQNPTNFPSYVKNLNVAVITAVCAVNILAATLVAPSIIAILKEFESQNQTLASFVISVYLLGLGVGPLIFAPMSEFIGRAPVYHISVAGFLIFNIACAKATSMWMLIGMRFMTGIFGSVTETNGSGTIADLVPQAERGKMVAIYALGPVATPMIGPIIGGYLTESMGWRWNFWFLAILSGFFGFLGIVVLRETNAAVILRRKAALLRKKTGNQLLTSELDAGRSSKQILRLSTIRPVKLLVMSPIVLITAIFLGAVYGWLYLLITTIAPVFKENYGFTESSVGLASLGFGIGNFFGLGAFAWIATRTYSKAKARHGNSEEELILSPECRLEPLVAGYLLVPISLVIYGWSVEYHVHYIIPIMSTALIGFGNILVSMSISLWIIDSFQLYSASALTGNTFLRSILGTLLPLAGPKMYAKMGFGWGNSVLALTCLIILPVPLALVKWGERLRVQYEVKIL